MGSFSGVVATSRKAGEPGPPGPYLNADASPSLLTSSPTKDACEQTPVLTIRSAATAMDDQKSSLSGLESWSESQYKACVETKAIQDTFNVSALK